MRKKLLFATFALLLGWSSAWADTSLLTEAAGWQKITELPSDLDNYYFTIVDNSNDLMLALSRGNKNEQTEAYNGLYYANSANSLVDKSMLFTLQKSDNFWVMTNAEYNSLFLQTEWNAAQYYRTHDNGGNNLYWGRVTFAYSDGAWTIQNGVYPDQGYLGPWNNEIGHGKALAFNKTGNSVGKFQIYAILKTKANEYYDALRAGTGASESNPIDMTALLVNPNARFWTGSIPFGWTTTGTQNVNNGNGYDLFPGIFEFSNWGASNWTGSLKQTVTVPNGKYVIKAAFMAASGVTAYLTSNGSTAKSENLSHFGASGGNIAADGSVVGDGEGDRGWTYLTLETKVTTGSLELGAYAEANAEHLWVNADNFTLTYLGADIDILKESYQNALEEANAFDQSTIKEIAVKEALADAISTYTTVEETQEALTAAVNALQTATSNASASVAAYTSAKDYFDKMGAVLDGTNVYTQEAYNAKYGTWLSGYNEGTLSTATAASLNADVAYSTGWHSNNNIDDILLSTWTIGGEQAKDYDKSLYINTWSTEGETDGSEFYTPFFEYWVSSGSLAANTITSTVTGLKANTTYSFTIRARVQGTTEKIANGITMKVGEGTAVDISAGAQFKGGNFYIGNFSAMGQTDADGKLETTITIAASSNISWLSFYDCKYTEGEDLSAYIADYEFALNTAQDLNTNTDYTVVTGKERGDLQAAISTYASVDNTDKAALIAAKNALETASNTFVNAAYDYITLADLNENVATKLGVTWPTVTSTTTAADINAKAIVVAEVTAARAYTTDVTGKLGTWSATPNANQKGESWNGEADDTYYDSYNGETTMTQTVTLPAGDYALIFKCRASAAANVNVTDGTNTVRFAHKGNTGRGIATNGTATFADGATYARNGAGQGWEYRVLTFTSDGTTATTLTFNWNTKTNQWAGLDDIELRANLEEIVIEANGTSSTAYDNTQEGLFNKVTLNRPISAAYNTLVLPFDVSAEEVADMFGEGAEVYVVSEYESGKKNIKLAAQDGIEANRPVILKATVAGSSYEFYNKTLVAGEPKTEGTGVSMIGTYAASISVPQDNKSYVISGENFYLVDSDVIIRNTRAYIQLTDETEAKSRLSFSIVGDEATGIDAVEGGNAADNGAIYNLSGQRVGKDYKGIVIKNGKKVMMR